MTRPWLQDLESLEAITRSEDARKIFLKMAALSRTGGTPGWRARSGRGRVTGVEVVVLGIVQGLTEFLPISSSAHLRITSAVFFHRDAGAASWMLGILAGSAALS